MACMVCRDSKLVRLPVYRPVEVLADYGLTLPDAPLQWKEFPCPECTPYVPYRNVRATKIATQYPTTVFGKMQTPIERGLAARFGEYLYREGLIRFTTDRFKPDGTEDFLSTKVTVTAHLGVVSPADVKKAGATPEVALTAPPPLPKKLERQLRERTNTGSRAVRWEPPKPEQWPEDAAAEFDDRDPTDALAGRFSGLEL